MSWYLTVVLICISLVINDVEHPSVIDIILLMMVMAPPLTHDSLSNITLLLCCQDFLHRHSPPQSLPSHYFRPSLHSQQQPSPWDCSTIPTFQLPATTLFRGPAFLSRSNGQVQGCVLIFSYKNSKTATCCWTTIDRRMLDPTKKKKKNTPHPRVKEKPH